MDKIEDMIKDLNNIDEEEREKLHYYSRTLREIADHIDELAVEGKTPEEIEEIIGKLIIKIIKIKAFLS